MYSNQCKSSYYQSFLSTFRHELMQALISPLYLWQLLSKDISYLPICVGNPRVSLTPKFIHQSSHRELMKILWGIDFLLLYLVPSKLFSKHRWSLMSLPYKIWPYVNVKEMIQTFICSMTQDTTCSFVSKTSMFSRLNVWRVTKHTNFMALLCLMHVEMGEGFEGQTIRAVRIRIL